MSYFRILDRARRVPYRIRIVAAAASLSAFALTGLLFATAVPDAINNDVYPENLTVRAELHQGETLRNVEFYPDNITPRSAVAFNNDGTTSNYNYRPDGTLETAKTIRTTEDGTEIVIRSATFLTDGKTYVHDVAYFEDGVRIAKETRLIDAATQHRQYFHPNGAVRSDQTIVYDSKSYSKKGWKLSTESVYRLDATLLSTYRLLENDGSERYNYSEKGLVSSYKKLSQWASNYEEGEFQADGKTPIRVMTQDHTKTEVTTYRLDGTVAEKRTWYGALTSAMMSVTEYDTRGIRILNRNYMSAAEKFRLYTITTFDAAGIDERRNIYMEVGGAINETVYNGDGSKWTRRLFGVNGLLYKEFDMEAGKGQVATRDYTEADNIRVDIPAEWLVMSKFETPQQIIPYIPQGMQH